MARLARRHGKRPIPSKWRACDGFKEARVESFSQTRSLPSRGAGQGSRTMGRLQCPQSTIFIFLICYSLKKGASAVRLISSRRGLKWGVWSVYYDQRSTSIAHYPADSQRRHHGLPGRHCLFGLHFPDHILSVWLLPIEATARLQLTLPRSRDTDPLKQYVQVQFPKAELTLLPFLRYVWNPKPNQCI